MSDGLIERIVTYAEAVNSSPTAVISLKLRPVQGGAQYTDPFGRQDANGYLYPSEYAAAMTVADVGPVPETLTHIAMVGRSIRHPSPWSGDPNDFIFAFRGTEPPALWIQHETGLEILGAVAAIVGIITGSIKIWEKIRDKILANTQTDDTDRYYKEITEIRVELRHVDSARNLEQELIYTERIQTPIDQNPLVQKLQDQLKK